VSPADVGRNVLIYVPFGVLGMLTLARSDPRGVARVTLIALLFSLVVETLQLYTVDRVASLADIGSAGIGAAMGASLVAAFAAGAR
jgi:VanZ family protein